MRIALACPSVINGSPHIYQKAPASPVPLIYQIRSVILGPFVYHHIDD